jgi:hypothetical protein
MLVENSVQVVSADHAGGCVSAGLLPASESRYSEPPPWRRWGGLLSAMHEGDLQSQRAVRVGVSRRERTQGLKVVVIGRGSSPFWSCIF